MKIEIRIGDTSFGTRKKYESVKCDNVDIEKKSMYDFLASSEDCIIEDVDNFLLYTLNNGLMAHIVNVNSSVDKDYNSIPKFDPKIYKVFVINDDGSETSLQTNEGNILKNYFDILMKSIMDDYYTCLNYYQPTNS